MNRGIKQPISRTHFEYGAHFEGIPILAHGLNCVMISHNARIGKNCTINHRVTIGEGKGGAPIIGDNVMIGTGANIIGGITIGNNVKIGSVVSLRPISPIMPQWSWIIHASSFENRINTENRYHME